jgi:hypothetical protein
MNVNVTAIMRLTRAVLPLMREAKYGSIVNVSSEAGLRGSAAGTAYTTSKHAVIGFTKSTSFFYAQEGIRCNAVAPGGVATNIEAPFNSEFAGGRLGPFMQLMVPPIATSGRRCDDKQGRQDMSKMQNTTENGNLRSWVAGHQILSFFLLAYAISWSLWGIAALGGGQVVFLLGGLGPLVSALLITRLSGRSVRGWLRSLLVWRVSLVYYAIALLLPAAIYAVINLVLFALVHELDFSPLLGVAPGYLGTFLLVATVGGGFEEPGWRGFALPRLQARRSPPGVDAAPRPRLGHLAHSALWSSGVRRSVDSLLLLHLAL